MADLFQSEYDVGSLRRGVQDGETLWALLAEDGTVTVVPDPTAPEVEAAQKELSKLARRARTRTPTRRPSGRSKIAAASRTVNFQAPPSNEPIVAEEEEEKAGNGRRKAETAEAR